MKNFTFDVTQTLVGFYEGKLTIKAKSEADARKKLAKMSQSKLEDLCEDWEQNTDNASSEGDIEIQSLSDTDDEDDEDDY
jgi:hypothetical protein